MTTSRTLAPADREGTISFGEYETWYRITGELRPDVTPLVALHGGPGCTHDYLLTIADPVHPTRRVPERTVLLVSAVSLVLGLFFVGQIGLLSSLVNFGALFSFLLPHVSVVAWYLLRRRQRTYGLHLLVPLPGFVIIGYVLVNADTSAKIGGLVWLAVGVVVLVALQATGRRTELKALTAEEA